MCLEQRENGFRFNLRVFANIDVKIHHLSYNFDSLLYQVVCLHARGEVDSFCVTLLSTDR